MSLTLLDWRRRVARLYAEVRSEPDPVAAHDHWRKTRDDLLRTHPDSPVPRQSRADYPGAPVAAYDPRLRFDVAVDTGVPAKHIEVATGSDGVVPFDRIGRAHLPGGGDLDVWWLGSYGGGVFVPVKDVTAGTATSGGGGYLIDTVTGAGLRAATRAGSSSTSTSPTTPPAPTTRNGPAHCLRRATSSRGRCWPGSSCRRRTPGRKPARHLQNRRGDTPEPPSSARSRRPAAGGRGRPRAGSCARTGCGPGARRIRAWTACCRTTGRG